MDEKTRKGTKRYDNGIRLYGNVSSRTRRNLQNVRNLRIFSTTSDALLYNLRHGALFACSDVCVYSPFYTNVLDLLLKKCDPVDVEFLPEYDLKLMHLLVEALSTSKVTKTISVFLYQVTEELMNVLAANNNVATLKIHVRDALNFYSNHWHVPPMPCKIQMLQDVKHSLTRLVINCADIVDGVAIVGEESIYNVLQTHSRMTHVEFHNCWSYCESLSRVRTLKSLKLFMSSIAMPQKKHARLLKLALQHPTLMELEIRVACRALDLCPILEECLPNNETLVRLRIFAVTLLRYTWTDCYDALKASVESALHRNAALAKLEITEHSFYVPMSKVLTGYKCTITAKSRFAKVFRKRKWESVKKLLSA
jgi:hypothetical protein